MQIRTECKSTICCNWASRRGSQPCNWNVHMQLCRSLCTCMCEYNNYSNYLIKCTCIKTIRKLLYWLFFFQSIALSPIGKLRMSIFHKSNHDHLFWWLLTYWSYQVWIRLSVTAFFSALWALSTQSVPRKAVDLWYFILLNVFDNFHSYIFPKFQNWNKISSMSPTTGLSGKVLK